MFTEVDRFVIEVAEGNGLITPADAQQLRAACQGNVAARALDLIRDNQLVSEYHLDLLLKAVADRFGTSALQTGAIARMATIPAFVHGMETGKSRYQSIFKLLEMARRLEASDLHLGVGNPPVVRVHGDLRRLEMPVLTAEDTYRLMQSILTDNQKKEVAENWQADFSYEAPQVGRFRVSVVKQRLGYDIVFRVINSKVPSFESLGLPAELKRLTEYTQGLVLVTGPVGSGKSTTMAALLEEINLHRHDHIITLEDPIEYVFEPKNCQITQREINTHTRSFAVALRAALREDPDIIMVGEMRDLATVSLAITAAETGHLVIGTLHTNNAARTIDRVLDVFPADQQAQICTTVSESLKGIICQQLVPRVDGKGRVLALEVLINNPAVAACIREFKTFLLPGIIQTGRKLGMRLMDDSLLELLAAGLISEQEAYERAEDKSRFIPRPHRRS